MKFTMFEITNELDSDKLNSNFDKITEDINTSKIYLQYLSDLYSNQMNNYIIINNYRATMYSTMLAMDNANSSFTSSGITMQFINVNTADDVTYTNTVAKYSKVRLSSTFTFNRFPTTTNEFGDVVPLYNSISATRNGTTVENNDPLYYAISEDPKRIFIESATSANTYIIESVLSTPLINSITIEPVFPGLQNFQVYHGFDTTWEKVGNYTSAFPMEIIFKQSIPNATGIKLIAQPASVGGSNHIGFYKIGAKYETFNESGTLRLKKSLTPGTIIKKMEMKYQFNDLSAANPVVFNKIFRIQIYDNTTLVYDSATNQYPLSDASLTIATGTCYIDITFTKYNDISPVFEYILLGTEI